MRKEYLKTYYYATIQYKGFYENTEKYESLEKLEQDIRSIYKSTDTGMEILPIIDYIIYEIKPIKRLLT